MDGFQDLRGSLQRMDVEKVSGALSDGCKGGRARLGLRRDPGRVGRTVGSLVRKDPGSGKG